MCIRDSVKPIWQKVGSFLNVDIAWKLIVLGFYHETNEKTWTLNNLLAFITFVLYKYKIFIKEKI